MTRHLCRCLTLAALTAFVAGLLTGCSSVVGNAEGAIGGVSKLMNKSQSRNAKAIALGQNPKNTTP